MTLLHWVIRFRRLEGTYCLPLQWSKRPKRALYISTLNVTTLYSLETLGSDYPVKRCHIPEEHSPQEEAFVCTCAVTSAGRSNVQATIRVWSKLSLQQFTRYTHCHSDHLQETVQQLQLVTLGIFLCHVRLTTLFSNTAQTFLTSRHHNRHHGSTRGHQMPDRRYMLL